MRLTSIVLEGFRGFVDRAQIDLDSDVVILHGPNGAGKTSLLDGILWCLTGKIDRFSERGGPVSLYAREGIARVELGLRTDDGTMSVVRSFDGDRMTVRVTSSKMAEEGPAADRALAALLFPGLVARQDAGSALSDVLTRSVYLQQDLVRQFVENDLPTSRFAVLSEIVGAGVVLDLQQTLEKSRAQWSRSVTSLKKEQLEPLESRFTFIEDQLARLSDDRTGETPDARAASLALFESATRLLGKTRINTAAAPTTSGELDRFLRELEGERDRLERDLATLASLLEEASIVAEADEDRDGALQLEVEEKEQQEEVDRLDKAIQTALAELSQLRERQVADANRANRLSTMAQIALEELGDTCPVCQQSYDAEHTIVHLRELISLASSPPEVQVPASADTETLSFERARAVQLLETVRSRRSDLRQREAGNRARRAQYLARLSDFGISETENVATAVAALSRRLQDTVAELGALIRSCEQLSLSVVKLGEQRRRSELVTERQAVSARLADFQRQIAALERTHVVVGEIIEGLREASMEVTESQVRRVAPLFQRIYSRIDPHPTFRVTQILARRDRGRGQVTVGVSDPVEQLLAREVSSLLSSSQLNSFAVSLFLALNLSMKTTPLEMVVLDDPLQSLDSINLLGLVDVLRRIRDHRQIFVSTHEDRLYGLLQRKLRPVRAGQRMITLSFSDWTRNGPTFQESGRVPSGTETRVLAA